MKLLIMQSHSIPCYLLPLMPKHLPQDSVLGHPQRVLLPQCERPSFAKDNIVALCFNIYIIGQQTAK
jgi:hypothetical protein